MPDIIIKSTELGVGSGLPDEVIANRGGKTVRVPASAFDDRYYTESEVDIIAAAQVPKSRRVSAGNGLTGGGDLSVDRSIAVDFVPVGGDAGIATTAARSDHAHSAYANPAAATTGEITAGSETAARLVSPAQIKLAAQTHGVGAQLAASGGDAGSATTAARSDHTHPLATSSAPGLQSAADRVLLDSVGQDDQWSPQIMIVAGNVTSTARPATVNTACYIAGSALGYRGLGSLKYVSSARLFVDLTAAQTTLFCYAEFSLDGGSTWVLDDGATVSSPANAAAAGVAMALSSVPATRTWTVPAAIRNVGDALRSRVVFYDTTAISSTFVCNRAEIQAKRNAIVGATPAVTSVAGRTGAVSLGLSDVGLTATGTTDVRRLDGAEARAWSGEQLSQALRVSRWDGRVTPTRPFPTVMTMRRAKRIDVTSSSQAGANAVTADGATDCRAKLFALEDSFGEGGGVLFFPPGSGDPTSTYYRLAGPVLRRSNVVWLGRYGHEEETRICNMYSSASSNNFMRNVASHGLGMYKMFGSTSQGQTHRKISDVVKGQNYIVCQADADYNACSVGDQIYLMTPQWYQNIDAADKAWVFGMFNYIVAKRDSDKMLSLLWEIPFDLSTNGDVKSPWSPTGEVTFFRTAEVSRASGPGVSTDDPYKSTSLAMQAPRGCGYENLTLASGSGHVFAATLPLEGKMHNLIVESAGAVLYGNFAQYMEIDTVAGGFGRDNLVGDGFVPITQAAAELSCCGFGNRIKNLTTYALANITAGAVLVAFQEGSWGNTLDGYKHIKSQYVFDPDSSDRRVFRITGAGNAILNSSVELYNQAGAIFGIQPQKVASSDPGTALDTVIINNTVVRGLHIEYVPSATTAAPGQVLQHDCPIEDSLFEGVRLVNPTTSNPYITLGATAKRNIFRDWEAWKMNVSIQAGAQDNEVTRIKSFNWSGTNMLTDSGTGTVKAAIADAPELSRYAR